MKGPNLAASFVVTVAALTGCSAGAPEAAPEPQPEIGNPPEPISSPDGSSAVLAPDPPPDTPDPETGALPDAPTDRPGSVARDGERCFFTARVDSSGCPPMAPCNPPAPERFEVKCPAADPSLPEAPPNVTVLTRPDGSCFYRQTFETACRPNRPCNPPAPRERNVRCPSP